MTKYTEKAEECRRMAVRARTQEERMSWLALAESWLRMFEATKASLSQDTVEAREKAPGPNQSKSLPS